MMMKVVQPLGIQIIYLVLKLGSVGIYGTGNPVHPALILPKFLYAKWS